MASVNKVILIGRLGRDPELRHTQGGKAVANFTLATDETWKDSSGEKQKKTEWHNIVVWGPSAENFVDKYLHKGDQIYLEGKIQSRSYEAKEGGTKYITEINVTDIKPLQTAGAEGNGVVRTARPATTIAKSKSSNSTAAQQTQSASEISDEDIPF